MARKIQVITTIPQNKIMDLVESKVMTGLDTMPDLNQEVKHLIRKYVEDNVGYDSHPIACISRYNGGIGDLKSVGTSAADLIPTTAGKSLWQIEMPEDMVISIEVSTLMRFSKEFSKADEEFEKEMLAEEFVEHLSVGYLDQEDVISFIPFIELKRCKFFAFIDQNWGVKDIVIPGVQELKINKLDVFK